MSGFSNLHLDLCTNNFWLGRHDLIHVFVGMLRPGERGKGAHAQVKTYQLEHKFSLGTYEFYLDYCTDTLVEYLFLLADNALLWVIHFRHSQASKDPFLYSGKSRSELRW